MRKLAIFLLFAFPLAAQQQPKFDSKKAWETMKASMEGHYGTFTITKIPKSCKHTRVVFGATVCRIYVTYPSGRIQSAHPIFKIEDWTKDGEDHSHGEDTLYHVGLINPTQHGVYIEGRPGHKIWWQVNNP